jgi:hypothetical protein
MTVIQALQNFIFTSTSGGGEPTNTFSVSPGATPIGATWTAGTSADIDITSGDITLTAQSPYTFTAYIWGGGGATGAHRSGGAGGFASATFTGSTSDVYVLKSNFGGGGGIAAGGGYGIFANSFTHANSRLIAGGGGGGSTCADGAPRATQGGAGGGTSGQNGVRTNPEGFPVGGFGGTSSAGGAGSPSPTPGGSGSALQGGGGAGPGPSGGGGGGYYGGGGGGFFCCSVNGGGGGGSGYVHPSLTNPVNNGGNLTTVAPSPPAASPVRGSAGNAAQPGRIYLTA